jgi:DNA protecting protein DprA
VGAFDEETRDQPLQRPGHDQLPLPLPTSPPNSSSEFEPKSSADEEATRQGLSDGQGFGEVLLGLASVRGLGRQGIRAIVEAYGGDTPRLVAQPDPRLLRRALSASRTPASEELAEFLAKQMPVLVQAGGRELEKLRNQNVAIIGWAQLPDRLADLPDGPRWLFVEGDTEALRSRPAVAVVGTRKASREGRQAVRTLARLIAGYPFVLISGLAEGIDEEAHRTSLRFGVRNIAFLGHGITTVFPTGTADVRSEIVALGGAVATEYLPNERYGKQSFVARNRLQAALADVVIPVEAAAKSGTAHTVRFARRYRRPVLGVSWGAPIGIAEDLRASGLPVFDVKKPADVRALDGVLRDTAAKAAKDTFPLSLIARELRDELRLRHVDETIWLRFLNQIGRFHEEAN